MYCFRCIGAQVMKFLKENGIENIETITVVMDPNNSDLNRGFAFVELETNRDAQRAFKKLQKKDALGKGRNIKVAWADSFHIPDEEDLLKVSTILLINPFHAFLFYFIL